MKTKINCISVLLLLTVFPLHAQIKGIVKDINNNPLEFANVALYLLPDTVLKAGTTTDSLGHFLIEMRNSGNSLLKVSMVGYKTEIVQPQKDQIITLSSSDFQLGEVTISAQMIQTFGSKDNLIIPLSIKEKSSSALTAIGQMPQFTLNALSNVLETNDRQEIKILINGLSASEQELMSISPQQIRRVEYYTQPPARYANLNVGAVINLITFEPNAAGFSGMINTKNSFTTGYGTNSVNLKWYNARNQLSFNYFIDYRNLDENRIDQEYEYDLEDVHYKNNYVGLPGKYKGEYHIYQANYINRKENDYTFSGKMVYRVNPGKENYTQNTSISYNDDDPLLGSASKMLKSNHHSYATDLYFSKILPKSQEITANVVGTFYKSTSDNTLSRTQQNVEDNYSYTNNVDNKSGSLIVEALYDRDFNKQSLSIGSRYFYKNLRQTYNADEQGRRTQQIAYVYAGLAGKFEKLKYNAELGLEYSEQRAHEVKSKSFFVVKPSLAMSYPLSSVSSIRLNSLIQSTTPDIALFTTNPIYLNYKYISVGNQNLKPYYTVFNRLQYQLSTTKLYLSTSVKYSYLVNPYLITFHNNQAEIVKTWDIKKSMSYTGMDLNVSWTPFSWFSIQPYFSLIYSKISGKDGKSADDWSKMLSVSATFSYKNFTLLSQAGSSYTNLLGDYIEKRKPYYVGELSWKKNLTTVSIQYIHNPIPAETYANNDVMKFKEKTVWNNFRNLVTVKFVYSFSTGKKNTIQDNKRISNQDSDSGLRKDLIAK